MMRQAFLDDGTPLGEFGPDVSDMDVEAIVRERMGLPPAMPDPALMMQAALQRMDYALQQMAQALQLMAQPQGSESAMAMSQLTSAVQQSTQQIVAALSAPKTILKDANGRPIGLSVGSSEAMLPTQPTGGKV